MSHSEVLRALPRQVKGEILSLVRNKVQLIDVFAWDAEHLSDADAERLRQLGRDLIREMELKLGLEVPAQTEIDRAILETKNAVPGIPSPPKKDLNGPLGARAEFIKEPEVPFVES